MNNCLYMKQYHKINKESQIIYRKKRYLINQERLKKDSKEYYHKNIEKIREKYKKWYSENKKEYNLYRQKYKFDHGITKKMLLPQNGRSKTKEYKKLMEIQRRSVISNAGSLTIETIQQVYESNIKNFKTLTCYLCFKPIKFGDDSIDHKIPISRRKEFPYVEINNKSNLGITHFICNCRKKDKTEEEYRNWLIKKGGNTCLVK